MIGFKLPQGIKFRGFSYYGEVFADEILRWKAACPWGKLKIVF
jgi:hypothetical protein